MRNTVIYWQIKGEMGLNLKEYVVADIIRQHSKKTGWCELSKKDIGGICGEYERGIFTILSRLEGKGYIERVTDDRTKDSRIRTTPVYNAFFPLEDGGNVPPDVTEAGTENHSEEAFKLAVGSMAEPGVEISDREKLKRHSIQPMVSEINLYAEKLYKNPIRVENLRPDEWAHLRIVCGVIGDKKYVAPALGRLYQLGALGGGSGFWFKGMAKEIKLVMDFCRQEEDIVNKYITPLNRKPANENTDA